jgi:hypothetical protein
MGEGLLYDTGNESEYYVNEMQELLTLLVTLEHKTQGEDKKKTTKAQHNMEN